MTEDKKEIRVTIKNGWWQARKKGTVLGDDFFLYQSWTPVMWDGDLRPSWHETNGLEFDPSRDIVHKKGEEE